jgi:hypothetical protein
MIIGASLYYPGPEISYLPQQQLLFGIPKVFISRVESLLDGLPRDYPALSHAASRVATEMMKEAGVEVIIPAYAVDAIRQGNRLVGLFVETKSGRIAIRAKVVVDATGDADIARRAGVPVRTGCSPVECTSPNVQPVYRRAEYESWNEGGLLFLLAGADFEKFQAFSREKFELSDEDKQWSAKNLNHALVGWDRSPRMVPIFRKGAESDEFHAIERIGTNFYVAFSNWFLPIGPNLMGGRAQFGGDFDSGNWEHMAAAESGLRAIIYDGVTFFRKHVPGFDSAYLLYMSPFLGTRGGPHIEGLYTLKPRESFDGLRTDDTLFVSYAEVHRGGNKQGHDMPYRMLLPKDVEALLVTGRGAAYLRRGHDPSTRARHNMMALGQATGIAAALAVAESVSPRALNVKKLQRALLDEGFYLGDRSRITELGLTENEEM